MKNEDVAEVIEALLNVIRGRWDRLGYLETEEGAFATGHISTLGPHAYLCRFYAGLSDAALDDAEGESERYLPQPYRDFLRSFNGGQIMGISLYGFTGGQYIREIEGIGQPISIRYQNAFYTRPEFIPEGHFGLGAMNGPFYSQGHLYLTSLGEVELINRNFDLVATKWPSFTAFLTEEITRQLSRYDDEGREIDKTKRLPGKTDDWEELGKEISVRRKREGSFLQKTLRKLSGFQK